MINYLVIKDINMAINIIDTLDINKPTFADIESGGLYVDIRLLQLYQSDIVYIIDFDYCDIESIKKAIKPLHTVWAGASYDFGCLNMTTDKYDDIQLLVRTAHPSLPAFSLNVITDHLVTGGLYKGLDKKKLQKAGFKPNSVLSEEQLLYSATDVVALSKLWLLPKVQEVREKLFYKIDMLNLKYCIQYQQNGALIATDKVREELDKLPRLLEEQEEVLQGLNSKSPKQVKERFAELIGVLPIKTDKPWLIDIITSHKATPIGDLAQAIYDNRRTRLRETNLVKLNTDKVFTRFNPYGTITGRFSSSGGDMPKGINFQNVTRDLQYLLEQDTEDTRVIHADYSTAELRSACSIMGDFKMREYLLAGVDLHKVSAKLAIPTIKDLSEVTKKDRQKGKAVSFGFIFGMSWARFKEYAFTDYNIVFTEEEAKEVKYAYMREYKDITDYHKHWWNNYKTEFVSSPMGRLAKPRLGTDAINFATQASIGETCKLALHYHCRGEDNQNIQYIQSQVHDAIIKRVPKAIAIEHTYTLVADMLKAWEEILKLPIYKFKDIPMGVAFTMGSSSEEIEVFNLTQLNEWRIKQDGDN